MNISLPSRMAILVSALVLLLVGTATLFVKQHVINPQPSLPFYTCQAKFRITTKINTTTYNAKLRMSLIIHSNHEGAVEFTGVISDGNKIFHIEKRSDFAYKYIHSHLEFTNTKLHRLIGDTTHSSDVPLPDYFSFNDEKGTLKIEMLDDSHVLLLRGGSPRYVLECI